MRTLGPRTFIVFALAGLSGALLLHVSQNVQKSEEKLAEIEASIERERETIRVLRAEWDYLNRPERLEKLAHDFLDLAPPSPEDFVAEPASLPDFAPAEPLEASVQAQPVSFEAEVSQKPEAVVKPKAKPRFSERGQSKDFKALLNDLSKGGSR